MSDRETAEAVAILRDPATIRARCEMIFSAAEADTLEHFTVDFARLKAAAEHVAEIIKSAYPSLDVPLHSRWRHFDVGGVDRWAALRDDLRDVAQAECARTAIDLVVPSVLLDAGAGDAWRYREPNTGQTFARSEGLAVASFHLFASGALSASDDLPYRADAAALSTLDTNRLAEAFQAGPDNPLVGLDGRAAVLRKLGDSMGASPELFGDAPARIGNLFDAMAARAVAGRLSMTLVFEAVLTGLAAVWPDRITIGGVELGDVGRHSAIKTGDATDGLVPFHKLSQWLSYSLIEPLQLGGLTVTDLDSLTGLPEYRNGGLFIDFGVLRPKHAAVLDQAHDPSDEVVVEWRALTVALLDRLAVLVRAELGQDANTFPLAKLLEGGTWRAGRQIAAEKRDDGSPPLRIISDGTLF